MFKLLTAAAICVGVTALSLPLIESATERASARQEPPARAQPGGYKSLTLDANPQGHFHVETVVNGRRLEMLADTGATKVVLTAQDAARIASVRARTITRSSCRPRTG